MLGDTLKALRDKKGVTQETIAEMLKIKRQTYSAYERNVSLPDILALVQIADYFDVSLEYLVGDEIKAKTGKKPLSPEQTALVNAAEDMSAEDMKNVLEYAEFLKQKRNS